MKIGINGFGRIGRSIARINLENKEHELVAINDTNPSLENMAYLMKYDSTYGRLEANISASDGALRLDGKSIAYSSKSNISDVNWADCDVIIDASGISSNVENAQKIVERQNNKILVTHSSNLAHREIILGVNEGELRSEDKIVSNSICDANAIAHVLKWINDEYGLVSGSVTTLHPWLSYQNLVDGASVSQSNPDMVWDDFALGRSSVGSLIPKMTTAVSATEKVLPAIAGKLLSFSYRIPTAIVTSSDLTLRVSRVLDKGELMEFLLSKIESSPYVIGNQESLVSKAYEKMSASACLDLQWLSCNQDMIKIVLWYDNEWGYCSRALDLISLMTSDEL